MILIGTRDLTRTQDQGDFYCPECKATYSYRLRAKRTFLTLYFIPVIPISSPEWFVQCDSCKSNWDPNVLEIDQASHEAAQEGLFREQAMRAAILVGLIDDHISEAEITALLKVGAMLLQQDLDREELGQLCSMAQQISIKPAHYLLTTSKNWTVPQRLLALQALFLVASAEGELSENQMKLLSELREILQLSDLEYEAAIEDSLNYVGV
ncbi:MAG: zinc-ribbon domain-containing protein [Planctomycetota bacterium]